VFGAAAVGLLMALVVALGESVVMRGRQPAEEKA
jgi:hypothetical protein